MATAAQCLHWVLCVPAVTISLLIAALHGAGFRAAAERGRAQAQLMLGLYLANGAAGEQNTLEARLACARFPKV